MPLRARGLPPRGRLPVEARRRNDATATPGTACADRGVGAIQKESEGESRREGPDGPKHGASAPNGLTWQLGIRAGAPPLLSYRSGDVRAGFTRDKPIIFAFHGYPWLIHRLTCRRANHHNLHVRGYKEEGTTTTPFDRVVLNDLDRFHLVGDVVDRVPRLGA